MIADTGEQVAAASEDKATEASAPTKKKRKTYRDLMLARNWTVNKRPSLYMPSKYTECHKQDKHLICLSKSMMGRQGNQPYHYQVMSKIYKITTPGLFTLSYSYQLEEMLEAEIAAYEGDEDNESLVSAESIEAELRQKHDTYRCQLNDRWIATCVNKEGKQQIIKPSRR